MGRDCAELDFGLAFHPAYTLMHGGADLNVLYLEMLPVKTLREAGGAANSFRFFMNEWFEERKAKIELDNKTTLGPSSGGDLMGILITSNIVIWPGNLLTLIQNHWLGVPG